MYFHLSFTDHKPCITRHLSRWFFNVDLDTQTLRKEMWPFVACTSSECGVSSRMSVRPPCVLATFTPVLKTVHLRLTNLMSVPSGIRAKSLCVFKDSMFPVTKTFCYLRGHAAFLSAIYCHNNFIELYLTPLHYTPTCSSVKLGLKFVI